MSNTVDVHDIWKQCPKCLSEKADYYVENRMYNYKGDPEKNY